MLETNRSRFAQQFSTDSSIANLCVKGEPDSHSTKKVAVIIIVKETK